MTNQCERSTRTTTWGRSAREHDARKENPSVKIGHRLITAGTVLITLMAVLTYPSAATASPTGKGKTSASAMRAAPGVRLLWKTQDGGISKVEDFDCASTATCIVCEVAAIPPWQDSVSPIINFRGEVYCYQPDQGGRAAVVGAIIMQIGLWDLVHGGFVKLSYPPAQQSWVSQLGLTDATPITGCGVFETAVFVTIYFPECCPINASGDFGSEPRRIGC